MGEKDQVVKILRKALSPPFKATMGDGAGNVVVDGRPGYVWCRKLGRSEMLMQAYNRGAPTIEDIIVLLQESRVEHLGYEIIGVSSGGSPDNIYPPLPPHAWTHEWRPGIGRDRVTVYPRAWGYLRAEPILTGSMNVWVTPGWYYHDGEYHWYRGAYSPGFGAPTGSTWFQTLYMDPSDESLHIIDGVTGGYGYAMPPAPPDCMLPIAAVESTGTFSNVNENMIEDIRLFMDPIAECGDLIQHGHSGTASGGLLDHGLAHTPASLLDDDHHLYLKERLSGGLGTETPVHTHVAGEGGQLTAANIINIPAGGIAATDVQAAVNELDTEKAPATHTAQEPFDGHLNNPCCRVYHDTEQTIPDTTWTVLDLNSERFDTDDIHDPVTNNSRLTCKTAGKYQITAQVIFAVSAVGARRVQIRLNNTSSIVGANQQAVTEAGIVTPMNITCLWDMAVNDYVEVRVYQSSGGNLNIDSVAALSPEFMMVRVG